MTEGEWVEFLSRPEIPQFQEQIAHSMDLTARLVFADWIDEYHPDPDFAQALRSSITPDFNGESVPCPGFPGERLGAQLENGQFV